MPESMKEIIDAYVPRVIVKLASQGTTDDEKKQFQLMRYERIATHASEYLGDAWILLENQGVTVDRLITSVPAPRILELRKRAMEIDSSLQLPNFLDYFAIHASSLAVAKEIITNLKDRNTWPSVEGAYLEGGPALPPNVVLGTNESANQQYLDPSPANGGNPGGIDARFAWTRTGGDGAGTQFMDIEWGWILDHEDLPVGVKQIPPPIHGQNRSAQGHGTAALGTVVAQDNNVGEVTASGILTKGCVGIVPHVKKTFVASPWEKVRGKWKYSVASAIMSACDVLTAGDVLLLEVQTRSADRVHYFGFPVEVEEAEFNAISHAVCLQIVVIEAAGNLGDDLDQIIFNTWTMGKFSLNPSSPYFMDSGAIMVGASDSHRRTPVYNYGQRINCYAWADSVWTTGFDDQTGPIPSGTPKTESYIGFGGTSAASAIIAGAALSIQGIKKARGVSTGFSPRDLRKLLSDPATGTLSATSSRPSNMNADRIGVMPDLRSVIKNMP